VKVNKSYFFSILGFLFFFIGNALASEYMNLEDSINAAIQNNPVIKAQDEEVMGKEMEQRSTFGNMLPRVNLGYGYTRLNEKPFLSITGLGEVVLGTEDNYQFTVEATQPLFAGGALYNNYRISKNNYLAADLDRQTSIRGLKQQVIEAYYGVIQARQVYEVAVSGLSSIKAHLDVANAFYKQGMIPKNDLLEAQVRFAESEQNLIIAENAIKISESNLNLLLGRDLSIQVVIDSEIPMQEMVEELDTSTATALEMRQEVKIIKLQIDNAHKAVQISRAGYLPSVAATYSYERTGEDPDVEDDSWVVGVGLSWDIFEGGSNYYDVLRAKSLSAKLEYLMKSLQDTISLEVKNAYLSAKEASARTRVAEKAIDQAKENLRIQKDRYNLQVATTTNVLDAQSLLDQAMRNYITAKADYAKGIAKLHSAMGTL
jgi:outer membrane protein